MKSDGLLSRFLGIFGIYVSPAYPSPDTSLDYENNEDSFASDDTDSIESDFPAEDDEGEEVTYFEYGDSGEFLGTTRVEYIAHGGHLKHMATSVMFFDYQDQGCTEDRLFIPLSNSSGAGDAKLSLGVDSRGDKARERESSSTVLVRAASSSNTNDIVWDFPNAAFQKDESVTDLLKNNHGGNLPTKVVSHLEVKAGDSALGELIHQYGSWSRSRCRKLNYNEAMSFMKYIPVNENKNGIIPFSSFNRCDPKGWCDLQVMLTKLCSRRCQDVPEGKSAPSLPLKKSTSDQRNLTHQAQLHDDITGIPSGNRATPGSRLETKILDGLGSALWGKGTQRT